MPFWKTETCDDAEADNSNAGAKNDGHQSQNSTTDEESTQQLLDHAPMFRSLSPSKQAVHIMNATSGLCADPFHYHSFATVGGDWTAIPSPQSLFAGAFQKCAACHGRLGGVPRAAVANGGGGGDASAAAAANNDTPASSPPSGMLRCVACGVYAHRSCAFARRRPTTTCTAASSNDSVRVGRLNVLPRCEVNSIAIERALGSSSRERATKRADGASRSTDAAESSSWSIFGRGSLVSSERATEANGSKASSKRNNDEEKSIPKNIGNMLSNENADASQSNGEDAGNAVALKEKKEPSVDEPDKIQIQQPGVVETSINLIKKTSETATNIPKVSAIGMVAGGAAGLVIAGPAGAIVGSQIGRTVLAVGAAVEGGIGVSVLAMSLAAAANFRLSSASEEERELKLNSTLVLVRPDIAVDSVWGEYSDEARRFWAEKRSKELSSSQSSCGSFGIGSIGSLFQSTNSLKEDMRYRKDSDIIKADASELPMREKVFLLVNRILNDKMSLPGYLYRYLIVKHTRRTMFGHEGSAESTEEENSRSRLSRQDAHGVIKHVTATLLEVRPGLASSPAMTELSASAVEVLVFGELYDDVFKEFVRQTEEKDDGLLAKVKELQERCGNECAPLEDRNDVFSVSQSAITALRSLPQAHTSTEKLMRCVEFLEYVSEHFSSSFQDRCIDADTMLVMVCQHVVAANISHLHAEVAFIEEFSRDEQLLSGKEGYALITLQASLHYLDSLDELPSDLSFSNSEIDGGAQQE